MRQSVAFASVGLRARLVAVTLLAASPFVGIIAGLEYDRGEKTTREHVIEAGKAAAYAANQTSGFTSAIGDTLRTIASFPSIRSGDYSHCRAVLAAMLSELRR